MGYDRQIRISVSNLDIPPQFPGPVKEGIKGVVAAAVAPKFDMDLEMMYEMDGKPGRLQAVETAESPINRHPVTGMPVWFNNAHNHARKLRDRRPCGVPEVGMAEGFYAVTWFTWDRNEEWRGNERRIVEKNAFNQAINGMMDWLPKDFESNQS